MDQAEAIEFVRGMAVGKSTYRMAKILGISWATARNWLSKNPKEISYPMLQKLQEFKNSQNTLG